MSDQERIARAAGKSNTDATPNPTPAPSLEDDPRVEPMAFALFCCEVTGTDEHKRVLWDRYELKWEFRRRARAALAAVSLSLGEERDTDEECPVCDIPGCPGVYKGPITDDAGLAPGDRKEAEPTRWEWNGDWYVEDRDWTYKPGSVHAFGMPFIDTKGNLSSNPYGDAPAHPDDVRLRPARVFEGGPTGQLVETGERRPARLKDWHISESFDPGMPMTDSMTDDDRSILEPVEETEQANEPGGEAPRSPPPAAPTVVSGEERREASIRFHEQGDGFNDWRDEIEVSDAAALAVFEKRHKFVPPEDAMEFALRQIKKELLAAYAVDFPVSGGSEEKAGEAGS